VVGIGEDGWEGLPANARRAVENADLLIGSARCLALLPASGTERIPWPSPLYPLLDAITERYANRRVAILASGDPMLHGIGVTLARRINPAKITVIPHVSAFTLACARLGLPTAETPLLSAVYKPLAHILPYVQPERTLIVYAKDAATPAALAALLREHGYGASVLQVFEYLGGPRERRFNGTAASWDAAPGADLNLIAVTCLPDAGTRPLSRVPGLRDEVFETDGQLTKSEVRAVTLASLAPLPGQLLWDLGAGTGSIGIEWMRAHASCRCIAVERDAQRARRIAENARRLGVPELRVLHGNALETLEGMERPHAVFIGGGLNADCIAASLRALLPGGRLVANVVTVEGEALLAAAHAAHGGELTRIAVSRAQPLGATIAWRPLTPVTQWRLIV
jgi:precorrin-6Y C5,15-methyltransferase (decarboxylating)